MTAAGDETAGARECKHREHVVDARCHADDIETERCVAVGQQYVLQQKLRNPECVSREVFTNALSLAANRGLLDSGGRSLVQRRRKFAAELAAVVHSVGAIDELGGV